MSLYACGTQCGYYENGILYASWIIEDPTDPDIAGIGIMISFVFTAVLSLGCVTVAFFNNGIQSSAYSLLDEITISRVQALFKRREVRTTIADEDALSPYQAFLLAMSDQALMTGIGSVIALYAQMCNGLSLFSFQVGVSLAQFCAGIHFNTLTALRVYFRNNRKQAVVRIALMVVFLIISLPSLTLQTILTGWLPDLPAACGIRMLTYPAVQYRLEEWTTLCIFLTYTSVTDMMYIEPQTAEEQINREARRSPVISLMVWLPWSTKFRRDVELALVQRQDEITGSKLKAAKKIRNSSTGRDALAAMLPYLWRDTFDSLVLGILTNYFWFALSVKEIVGQLKVEVDLSPLLSWKYGQLMPMILMLAYILTALQASNDKRAETRSSHTPALLDEAQSKTALAKLSNLHLNEPHGGESQLSGRIQAPDHPLPPSVPEEEQARTTGSEPSVLRAVKDLPPVMSSECEGTAVRRVNSLQMSSTHRAADFNALRKTTSAPTTQAPAAPVRYNTVSLEAQDSDRIQRPEDLDVVGIAYATHRAIVHKWTVIILFLIMCWQAVVFMFFEFAVSFMAGIWFLKHALRTGKFFKALYRVRMT